MECHSDNSQLFISWLFPIRQSIYYIYYLQQEQSFRIAVKNSDFEKLKKRMVYRLWKINLYTVIYVLAY
jgi:hypothetical protein